MGCGRDKTCICMEPFASQTLAQVGASATCNTHPCTGKAMALEQKPLAFTHTEVSQVGTYSDSRAHSFLRKARSSVSGVDSGRDCHESGGWQEVRHSPGQTACQRVVGGWPVDDGWSVLSELWWMYCRHSPLQNPATETLTKLTMHHNNKPGNLPADTA